VLGKARRVLGETSGEMARSKKQVLKLMAMPWHPRAKEREREFRAR
jgi:hypothetical protein